MPRERATRDNLLERLAEKVPVGDGCWPWAGTVGHLGYGFVYPNGRQGGPALAHRVMYELLKGPIPEGLTLDHLCRNRACVNPSHLEAVSQRENTLRSPVAPAAINSRKTHCLRGHAFSPENTYLRRDRRGRQCRACSALRDRKRHPHFS